MSIDLGTKERLKSQKLEFPVLAAAPMVGQSDVPFMRMTLAGGASLAYSEMLYAKSFADDPKYRACLFDTIASVSEEERDKFVIQFGTNSPDDFSRAIAAGKELGLIRFDLNLGCPQRSADELGIGASLIQRPLLVKEIYMEARKIHSDVFLSAKVRLMDLETWRFLSKVFRDNSVGVVVIHGRWAGSERHRRHGLADMLSVKEMVFVLREIAPDTVTIANGNIRCRNDWEQNLRETCADGVMSASTLLRDPWLFSPSPLAHTTVSCRLNLVTLYGSLLREDHRAIESDGSFPPAEDGLHNRHETSPNRISAYWTNWEVIRGHLRELCSGIPGRPAPNNSTWRGAQSMGELFQRTNKFLCAG